MTIRRRKRHALFPEIREQWCDHTYTPYRGRIPCTGPLQCKMCGLLLDPETREILPGQTGDNAAEVNEIPEVEQ